jgi:hypothetical protein
MEARLEEQGRSPAGVSAAELEALWAQAKQEIG